MLVSVLRSFGNSRCPLMRRCPLRLVAGREVPAPTLAVFCAFVKLYANEEPLQRALCEVGALVLARAFALRLIE
jgi:hypothetical protein